MSNLLNMWIKFLNWTLPLTVLFIQSNTPSARLNKHCSLDNCSFLSANTIIKQFIISGKQLLTFDFETSYEGISILQEKVNFKFSECWKPVKWQVMKFVPTGYGNTKRTFWNKYHSMVSQHYLQLCGDFSCRLLIIIMKKMTDSFSYLGAACLNLY